MWSRLAFESLFDQGHEVGRRDRLHDVICPRAARLSLEYIVVKSRHDYGRNRLRAQKQQLQAVESAQSQVGDDQIWTFCGSRVAPFLICARRDDIMPGKPQEFPVSGAGGIVVLDD